MNYMKPCRFREFLIQLCKKKMLFGGFLQKYYSPELLPLGILVQGFFKGLCSNRAVPADAATPTGGQIQRDHAAGFRCYFRHSTRFREEENIACEPIIHNRGSRSPWLSHGDSGTSGRVGRSDASAAAEGRRRRDGGGGS